MTWAAARLNRRIEIREAVQTPNSATGGFDYTYNVLANVWAACANASGFGTNAANFVNEQNTSTGATHTFTVRQSHDMDFIYGGTLAKGNHFIFMHTFPDKGRLFRIVSATNVKESNEFIKLNARELESQSDTRFYNG